jgi:hypothetical protein
MSRFMNRTYIQVAVIEAAVVAALWWLGRLFS